MKTLCLLWRQVISTPLNDLSGIFDEVFVGRLCDATFAFGSINTVATPSINKFDRLNDRGVCNKIKKAANADKAPLIMTAAYVTNIKH